MAEPAEDLFAVWWFDPDDTSYSELKAVDARRAVEFAKSLTERPAALMGVIRRVIITDAGDHTVFEWKYGEGVTFPPRSARPNHGEH